jgi:hypothetical protein
VKGVQRVLQKYIQGSKVLVQGSLLGYLRLCAQPVARVRVRRLSAMLGGAAFLGFA